ncbi:MAG: YtxH domain-containing protein [Candidatus Gastranaerophilales bacterium]|jgi:gas vesicle protein|nr:YtxH domain-containing protein [Candidatus Gastranaerophilales bacterium]
MSADKFFAGFIVGGALGALAGILLAPSSGEVTRKNISKKTNEVRSKAESSMKDIQSKTEVMVDEIQKKGDELLHKVQSLIPSNN